jgi:hypothetical protein
MIRDTVLQLKKGHVTFKRFHHDIAQLTIVKGS